MNFYFTPKVGNYLNLDRDNLEKALIYCSAAGDITKCKEMAAASGYHTIAESENNNGYVKCNDSSCEEVTDELYGTCEGMYQKRGFNDCTSNPQTTTIR
ncbi:hypothetical protein PIROE2DRAFT_3313 [Piromyces sp. E2]|nr:hypothetical protein PIROE2DRAFT_3313 [Piromyces sp. E2]|eukprot:OUM68923.1 hypothetical protein PIROE2DRAFT_3313 [Piromyces sp. E2]